MKKYRLRIADQILKENLEAPAFKMILTGVGDYAYRDRSGVLVVPITALRP